MVRIVNNAQTARKRPKRPGVKPRSQGMPNGNYVFDSGSQGPPPNQFGQSIEVLPDGTKTYVQEVAARVYRSFRLSSLYQGIRH